MNIPLGARLDTGTEVIVYRHGTDPTLVVKIPQPRFDTDQALAERIAGHCLLHQAHLGEYVLETHWFIPGVAGGHEYAFVETQTRVQSTLFGDMCTVLGDGRVQQALEIAARFFDFERDVLWASGVILRDAGSFMKNVAVHRGRIQVLDFSSFSSDPRALERFVLCAKDERRIHLLLDKLHSYLPGTVDGLLWNEFCAGLRKLAREHYRLDRMQQAWLTRLEQREQQSAA